MSAAVPTQQPKPTATPSTTSTKGSCGGHGIRLTPEICKYPSRPGYCSYCGGSIGTFVPPPPNYPTDSDKGVTRTKDGHIIGINWQELGPENKWLEQWKDKPIGPGHPLASHIDPRNFIPAKRSSGQSSHHTTTKLRANQTTTTCSSTTAEDSELTTNESETKTKSKN